MKTLLGTAALAAAVLAGCESTYNDSAANSDNPNWNRDPSAMSRTPGDIKHAQPGERYSLTGSSDRMSQDELFASGAAIGGMYEVQSSQLALQKSSTQQIKTFAQRMIDDHTKANDQLKSLAQGKGIALPTSLDAKHQGMYDKLNKLDGANFDSEYVRQQEHAHQKTVELFRSEQSLGSDADIKQFASSTLPTLQAHWDMVKNLQGNSAKTEMRHEPATPDKNPTEQP